MKVHEYQAKQILGKHGIRIPKGRTCFTVEEAVDAARTLSGNQWVVKAQIHAGGRGKGGGVLVASSIEEVALCAKRILGMQLITHQTGPKGKLVERLLVEKCIGIKDELYLALVVDRDSQAVTFIASREGGMDIESLAITAPEQIHTFHIDPVLGVTEEMTTSLMGKLYLPDLLRKDITKFLAAMYEVFLMNDATLMEINPLVLTEDSQIIALDAKLSLDDSAMYRHPDLSLLRDISEEDPAERSAIEAGLNYISLDGDIACLVNGAGLAMATMDIIKLCGGEPANFLDVGGGATAAQVSAAFEIMLKQHRVKVILINIFGGIMKCDVIATGIVQAVQTVGLTLPLVIRLEGTNAEEGRRILSDSRIRFSAATTMDEAAKNAVFFARV